MKKNRFPREPGRKINQEFSSTLTPDVNGGERSLPHNRRGAPEGEKGRKQQ